MGDPLGERGLVIRGLRFGHLLDEVQAHLFLVVERAPDLECRDILGPHTVSKIRQIRRAGGECRAGQHGARALAEDETPQGIGEIHWSGAQGAELLRAAVLLHPIDMVGFLEREKVRDRRAGRAQLAGRLLEF